MAANKLKNMKLTSVDFVRRGANPDADIMFFKSDSTPDEETIQKSEDIMGSYSVMLNDSFSSILNDPTLSSTERYSMLNKSLSEFAAAVDDAVISDYYPDTSHIEKNEEREETEAMGINKSMYTDDELSTLTALLAKSGLSVDDAGEPVKRKKAYRKPTASMGDDMDDMDDMDDDEEEGFMPPEPAKKGCKTTKKGCNTSMKKSDLPVFMQDALERMETLTKSMEMKSYEEIAKKYEPLGEDVQALAKNLYDLKESGNDELYKSYISILDKSLETVNKSVLFTEFGKSVHGASYTVGGVKKSAARGKIEAAASEIMKSNKDLTYNQAIAKAWEDNPDIAMEYEAERSSNN